MTNPDNIKKQRHCFANTGLSSQSCGFSSGHVCEVLRGWVVSDSLQPHGLWPARLLCPWGSPGKSTGVGFCVLQDGCESWTIKKAGRQRTDVLNCGAGQHS